MENDYVKSFEEAREKAIRELQFTRKQLIYLFQCELYGEVKTYLERCSMLEQLIKEYDAGIVGEYGDD